MGASQGLSCRLSVGRTWWAGEEAVAAAFDSARGSLKNRLSGVPFPPGLEVGPHGSVQRKKNQNKKTAARVPLRELPFSAFGGPLLPLRRDFQPGQLRTVSGGAGLQGLSGSASPRGGDLSRRSPDFRASRLARLGAVGVGRNLRRCGPAAFPSPNRGEVAQRSAAEEDGPPPRGAAALPASLASSRRPGGWAGDPEQGCSRFAGSGGNQAALWAELPCSEGKIHATLCLSRKFHFE